MNGAGDGRFSSSSGMDILLALLRAWFSSLLRFYPPKFRTEYQNEMEEVFGSLITDESRKGIGSLMIAWLRELAGLPISLLREFRNEHRGREILMPADVLLPPRARRVVPWKVAILAGLPHLLFALVPGRLLIMPNGKEDDFFEVVLGISLLLAFTAAAIHAWREGWPRWSASWFGYWIWAWFAVLANIAIWLNEKLALFVDWQFFLILLLSMLLLLVVGLYWLYRHDPIMSLLAALFLMPVGLPNSFMEFVPDRIEAFLGLGCGLITALCAAKIVRRSDFRNGLLLALGGNLLMGIAYSYVQVFKLEMPFPNLRPIHPIEFFKYLAIFILASGAVIAGPQIFWRLWDAANRRRPA